MEDSLGDRIWVDLEACKKLIDNIGTLFQTRPYSPGGGGSNSGAETGGMGTGIGTVSSTSGSGGDSAQSSIGEAGVEGVGGGEGRQGEELSLADIEVAPRLVVVFPLKFNNTIERVLIA